MYVLVGALENVDLILEWQLLKNIVSVNSFIMILHELQVGVYIVV